MSRIKKLSFESLLEEIINISNRIPDKREPTKTRYRIHDAILAGFAMMYHQDPSMLEFQGGRTPMQKANLMKQFGIHKIPQDSQMRTLIDTVDNECFRPVFKNFIYRLKKSNDLAKYRVLGNKYYLPLDGTTFFSSSEIKCSLCLRKNHKDGICTNHHQVLQTGIVHPLQKAVLPLMPEHIINSDGASKQDCEINAFRRMIPRIKDDYPDMQFIIGGDGLFSRRALINLVREHNMDYIFTAKPGDHKWLYEWITTFPKLSSKVVEGKQSTCKYEWVNDVPLHFGEGNIAVNFIRFTLSGKKNKKRNYTNTWVTNLPVSLENIDQMVAIARCRWKNENEFFNVLKNHGYCLEHNYGHGKRFLAFNFYLLTVLAFFMHQIFELTDEIYMSLRARLGSKRKFFNRIHAIFDLFVFETWSSMLSFMADAFGAMDHFSSS